MTAIDPFARRRSGILLHPTSLPGRWGPLGDLGPDAYRFVDFLTGAKQTVWQMLPLGPTHTDRSPYQCLSVHAGNPELISAEVLMSEGWIAPDEAEQALASAGPGSGSKGALIGAAHRGFTRRARDAERAAFAAFRERHGHWLDDFALYRVLRRRHRCAPWNDWEAGLRDRRPQALEAVRREEAAAIEQVCFEQFVFFRQWQTLRAYANERGVLLFGDMPIFVAYDSADVWAQRQYFKLNGEGRPEVVAGVPPDYFSATGQRWGNPHYQWERLQASGFEWWVQRISSHLEVFDLIRIDHFRGFEACWEIPAGETTATNGRWVKVPGDALFTTLKERFGVLPLVAEDLGQITPEVLALRNRFNLPGMKILQFAFDSGADNPYLPHNHRHNAVVYTGTHDNDTTLGWYGGLGAERRRYIDEYLGQPVDPTPWQFIRCALQSVARLAIIPLQDVLMLGSEHRMNRPGTDQGNWLWRFSWDQLGEDTAARRLARLTSLYGRE